MSFIENIQPEDKASDRERAHRSNLFLAAGIEVAGAASPVKIRNLSETGAMLEGPAFPAIGTILTLKRQEVEIDATVVWIRPPRCGVAFQGRIAVSEWVSGKRAAPDFGQGRAEEKSGAGRTEKRFSGVGAPAPAAKVPVATDIEGRIAEELAFVRRLLDSIGDELVDEPIFLQRHSRALQGFDLAGQILGNLANVLKAEDREAAIRAIGMEELRARLLRKALFDRD